MHRLAAVARRPAALSRSSSTASGLRSSRVALRKRFGQHLLKNADVVKNIVAAAAVQPHETAFEIGPGTGNMTVHLVRQARMLYAVELDRDMHRTVVSRIQGLGFADRFQCVCGDFLAVPLPPFDVLCANIPYQISSPVLDRLLFHRPLPRRAIIMFQLEFAQRCVARPGNAQYCRLSVNCALLCSSVRLVMRVDREQFRPPPKVDSGVVEFVPRAPPHAWLRRPGELAQWDAFLRLAFASKNKTLRSLFGGSKPLLVTLTVLRKRAAGGAGQQQQRGSDWVPAVSGDAVLRAAAGSCLRSEAAATRELVLGAIASAAPGSVVLDDGGGGGGEDAAAPLPPLSLVGGPESLLLDPEGGSGGGAGDDAAAEWDEAEDGGGLGLSAAPPGAAAAAPLPAGRSGGGGGPLLSARPNALSVEDLLAVFLALRGAGVAFPVAAQRVGLGAPAAVAAAAAPEA